MIFVTLIRISFTNGPTKIPGLSFVEFTCDLRIRSVLGRRSQYLVRARVQGLRPRLAVVGLIRSWLHASVHRCAIRKAEGENRREDDERERDRNVSDQMHLRCFTSSVSTTRKYMQQKYRFITSVVKYTNIMPSILTNQSIMCLIYSLIYNLELISNSAIL